MRADLPDGTVTFLFTDIEGSTRLLHELGAEAYAAALAEHRRILRAAFTAHGGVEVDTQGDAFFVAFPTAVGALEAARRATDELAAGPIRVRMGLHTGTPHLSDEGYVGVDVHRAARIAAAGHGGQVLVSSAAGALLPEDALHDLGPHRLKDLAAPERIFQLGHETFPRLKSLYATNLPIPTTPFIGRGREVEEIGDLLARSDVRLVTLTGPGGTGKTRLALQAAGEAGEAYPDGVWWVELADIRDGGLVAETVATIIGARDALARHIGERRMLLVIDNAEHLLDAVADVARLRSSCPNLELLVTSREPLRVDGEHEYPVLPLSAAEAYDLFMTRARAVRPDASDDGSVAAICARLDHLPLALELAAARTRVLAPRDLLARLEQRLALLTGGARDQPGRMRTLRATIEWSHDLLSAAEQILFRRLSVLRTWRLEDAEAVVDADLDTLGALVDKSLVRRTADRFWMLETIREYAAEQLLISGERDQYLDRHAHHFHDLALAVAEDLPLGRSASAVQLLDAEVDNLRGAMERLAEVGNGQMVLAMLGALAEFWDRSARPMEGYARTSAALALDARPTPARGRALLAVAFLAELTGDLPAAERWSDEAVDLHRALGDPVGEAIARHQQGYHAAEAADWPRARDLLEESLAAFREHGRRNYALAATRTLAWVYDELGDRDHSRSLSERNLADARSLGDRVIEATTLGAITGMFTLPDGDVEAARRDLRAAMRIWVELGDRIAQTTDLGRFVELLLATGEVELAARLLASAVRERSELGVAEQWVERSNEERRMRLEERLGPDRFAAAWEAGTRLSLEEAVRLALDG